MQALQTRGGKSLAAEFERTVWDAVPRVNILLIPVLYGFPSGDQYQPMGASHSS